MPYTIVLNGVEERSYELLGPATDRFERLKAEPGTIWLAIVKSIRRSMTVVAYYDSQRITKL